MTVPTSSRREALIRRFRVSAINRARRTQASIATGDADALESASHELHTLKGEASMLGFAAISALIHATEERLLVGDKRSCALCVDALDLVARSLDGTVEDDLLAKARDQLLEAADDDEPLSAPASSQAAVSERRAQWAQVSIARLDELCERVGALAGELKPLLQSVQHDTKSRAMREDIDRCTGELTRLEEAAWSLRIAPIGGVLDDLAAHARELGQRLKKPLRTTIVGGDIELERDVADAIAEPLLHLVRNAVDHGIESVRGDKEPVASIEISARAVGANVILRVADDGRGIDPEVMRRAAVERGILSSEEAASLGDDAARMLVFRPRLSTRAVATDLSGRGVGLDAVCSAVERVGGSVSVHSVLSMGSAFELTVPAQMTRERVLVVMVADSVYGIASRSVLEVIQPEGRETVVFRDRELGRRSLATILGHREGARATRTIVVDTSAGPMAFDVTRLIGERDLVVRPADAVLLASGLIRGGSVLEDGRAVPILANAALAREQPGRAATIAPPNRATRVLVVDDSPVVRDLLGEMLRAAGHLPLFANDGAEALAAIRAEPPDLVVSDLEMPILDGFELLRQVRTFASELPFVMLTTRAGQAERDRAASLGVSAFVAKGDFGAPIVVDLVRRLTAESSR